jgi:hypothetical protein
MDTRTLALSAAVVLTGLGLLLTFSEIFRPPPAPPTAVLATARGQIAPYTFVTQDMVAVGDTVPAGLAKQRGAWTVNDAVGKMSTALIAPGDTLTTGNVLPVEMMRYVEDMGLEIVSFQAAIDKAVAGRIRSGSLINLYGYGRDALNQPVTKLVQGRMWVVAVTAAGAALASATLVPDSVTGELDTRDSERRPGATLTVAVAPSISYKVIDALGAQGLNAWVTLAANNLVTLPEAIAAATPAPTRGAMPIPIDIIPTLGPTPPVLGGGWGQDG